MKKKVLILEDALDSGLTWHKMLNNHNLHILEAANHMESWKNLVKERPDLVVLDLYMPGKDGFEIIKSMAKEWIGVPIVVISDDVQQSTIESCFNSGATAFLKKPINISELKDAIKVMD